MLADRHGMGRPAQWVREASKLAGGIVLGVVFLVVGVSVLMAVGGALTGYTTSWRTDRAEMRQTSQRLRRVGEALDTMMPTAAAAPARVSGCTTDSGDLFQPRVNKHWAVQDAEVHPHALLAIESMESAGWSVESTDVRFSRVKLSHRVADWEARATLWWTDAAKARELDSNQGVFVEVTIHEASPCAPT